jgi:hypothetical protein
MPLAERSAAFGAECSRQWRYDWMQRAKGMEAEQRKRFTRRGVCLLLLVSVVAGLPSPLVDAGARNPCLEPGNLTHNCGFDNFSEQVSGDKRYQIPDGWWYFILSGDLEYRTSNDTYWGAPSLWMLSDGVPFTAGIYQQVAVTPGVVYQTDIGWAAVTVLDFERKLGLDPTGGTDPLAPTVVWSRSEWGMDKWPDLTVSARATGPMMTVFVWVAHPTTHGNDWIFLDAVGLWPDPNQPAATVTPSPSPTVPTPTRKPPTQTPSPLPPTDTSTAIPASPEATETWTPTPTQAPTWTATATLTHTPTPPPPTMTPLPSRTPLPTVPRLAGGVPTQVSESSAKSGRVRSPERQPEAIFLYIAGGALVGGIVLAALVLWLWLRGRRSGDREGSGGEP